MGRFEMRRAAAFVFVAATLTVACAKDNDADDAAVADSAAAAPAPAPAPAPTATPPSDAQIAHIAVTANTIDIQAGTAAKAKATNADVKSFAQMMITDHTAVNDKASALAKKLNLTPEDNPTSQQMNSDAATASQDIASKTGADYDKAYIAHEVTFHQQVLDAIDNTLIPNSQNAELKALLEQTRPAVAAHLERAKAIQSSLGQ